MSNNEGRDRFKEELESGVVPIDKTNSYEYLSDPPAIMTLEEKKKWERKLKEEIKRALEEHDTDKSEKVDKKSKAPEKEEPKESENQKENKNITNEAAPKSDDAKDDNVATDTEKAYLDKSQIIHDLKIRMYRKMLDNHTIVPDAVLFHEIIRLERENMYLRRDIKTPSENLQEKETENIKSEMSYEKKIRDTFMVKAKKVDRLTFELKECNDKIDALKKFQFDRTQQPDKAIDQNKFEEMLSYYESEKHKVLILIYMEDPTLMQEDIEMAKNMNIQRQAIIGKSDDARLNMLSDNEEILNNKDYANTRGKQMEGLVNNANKFMQEQEAIELERAEYRIKELEKEIREIGEPKTIDDTKKLIGIYELLADVVQTKRNIEDRKEPQTPEEKINVANDENKKSQEVRNEMDESLSKPKKIVEEYEGNVLKKPTSQENTTKDIAKGAVIGAVIGEVVANEPIEGAVVGSFIADLQGGVRYPENLDDAKAIIADENRIAGRDDENRIAGRDKEKIVKGLEQAEDAVENM